MAVAKPAVAPLRPQMLRPGVSWFPARTPTLPPATHTNSYALGEGELLLVEPATPFDDERQAWIEWVRGLQAEGRRAVAIFATHHHPDHVSGAAFLCQQLELPLWAHAATAERIDMPVARQLADGEQLLLAGPTPQRWACLHTPGHAPGHVCLHEETQGTLIVGDMVASAGTILIDPYDGDLQAYLQQLERLAALPATLALPAHGDPISEPRALFEHYIAHRLGRETKVVAALAKQAQGASLETLLAEVYADTPKFLWPLAQLSLESHLLKLEREGRAQRADDGWSGPTTATARG